MWAHSSYHIPFIQYSPTVLIKRYTLEDPGTRGREGRPWLNVFLLVVESLENARKMCFLTSKQTDLSCVVVAWEFYEQSAAFFMLGAANGLVFEQINSNDLFTRFSNLQSPRSFYFVGIVTVWIPLRYLGLQSPTLYVYGIASEIEDHVPPRY